MTKSASGFASSMTFFKQKITAINGQRLHLNRNKGLARYLLQGQSPVRNIALIDQGMGLLSFSLYCLRFTVNLGLLIDLIVEPNTTTTDKTLQDIYYELGNDLVWFSVNLSQFFWLSFAKSSASGMMGLQLETLANSIDLLVLLLRFIESAIEYEQKIALADSNEQARLAIEWEYKKWNFIRAVVTLLMVIGVFACYSFSLFAIPIAPTLSVVVLIGALIRLGLDAEKDSQLLAAKEKEPQETRLFAQQKASLARWDECNQLLLNHVFAPLGLFLLLHSSLPVLIFASLGMILLYGSANYFISANYSLLTEEESNLLLLK